MKLCRDVVLRQGYPPEELLYIDEKRTNFWCPVPGYFKGKRPDWNDLFSGNPMEKEAEDKSGKIKAEKSQAPTA